MADFDFRAIDPLALILSNAAYVRLTLPDPPPDDIITAQVKQVAAQLKGDERKQALTRAKTLAAYANAMVTALGGKRG